MATIEEIVKWFETGDVPTGPQFAEAFRSFLLKEGEEEIPVERIEGLVDTLNALTSQEITVTSITGWATYADDLYTEANPLVLTSGKANEVNLVNNASVVLDSEKPSDVDSFMDGATGKIKGRDGDAGNLQILFKVKPVTNSGVIDLTFSLDIGDGTTPIIIFPKTERINRGAGEVHNYVYNLTNYNASTWQANGAQPKIYVDGASVEVYDIIYYFLRTHKGGNPLATNSALTFDMLRGIIASASPSENNPFVTESALSNLGVGGSFGSPTHSESLAFGNPTGDIITHTQTGGLNYSLDPLATPGTILLKLTATSDTVSFPTGWKLLSAPPKENTENFITLIYDGNEVIYSATQIGGSVVAPSNDPFATDVIMTGNFVSGAQIASSYVYNDPNNVPESGTVVRFYIADDNTGTNEVLLSASNTVTLTASEEGKYLRLGVTPSNGTETGNESFSAYTLVEVTAVQNNLPYFASSVLYSDTELAGSVTQDNGVLSFRNEVDTANSPTFLTGITPTFNATDNSIDFVAEAIMEFNDILFQKGACMVTFVVDVDGFSTTNGNLNLSKPSSASSLREPRMEAQGLERDMFYIGFGFSNGFDSNSGRATDYYSGKMCMTIISDSTTGLTQFVLNKPTQFVRDKTFTVQAPVNTIINRIETIGAPIKLYAVDVKNGVFTLDQAKEVQNYFNNLHNLGFPDWVIT